MKTYVFNLCRLKGTLDVFFGRKPRTSSSQNTTSEAESNDTANVPVVLNCDEPLDISQKGEEKKIEDFRAHIFKKQRDGRSFQKSWLQQFSWLEYSKLKDAAFCYPCRQYGIGNVSDVFCTIGFNDWQKALSKGYGLKRHEVSAHHLQSMLSWKEHQSRLDKNQHISSLLNETVLEKRRYYFKSIISTILFLAKNELPFRGDWNIENEEELGLFLNLFKYNLERDEHLRHCQEAMPANATYTSPQIQNEIIQVITETVRQKIISEINESS